MGLIRYLCGHISAPMTDSHKIWAVDDFHHSPQIHGIQNAKMQEKFICDIIASVHYDSTVNLKSATECSFHFAAPAVWNLLPKRL